MQFKITLIVILVVIQTSICMEWSPEAQKDLLKAFKWVEYEHGGAHIGVKNISAEGNNSRFIMQDQNTLRDKLTTSKINVEYSQSDTSGQRILKPAINQAVSNVIKRQIDIRKNCGRDSICIPNLILKVGLNAEEYIVGSRKKIELVITVLNKGEDAFESKLYLYMPAEVNYVNIKNSKNSEVGCYGQNRKYILECDIGNPLQAGKKTEFTIILEPSKTISATSPDYIFIIEVNSTNAEKPTDIEDNKDILGLPLRVGVNLTINGVSDPNVLPFNASAETFISSKHVLEDIGSEISHSYTILNTGPTTIKTAEMTILWPTRDLRGNYLLYLVHQPIVKSKMGKAFCKNITLGDLNPLGLRSKNGNDGRSPPDSQPNFQGENHFVKNHDSYNDIISSRTKREFPTQSKKHRITQPAAIEQLKSCGYTNCTKIICTVYELGTNDSVLFIIRSRFWKENIILINLEEFMISSKLVALVTSLPYDVDHNLLLPYIQTASTKFYVTGLDKREPGPPRSHGQGQGAIPPRTFLITQGKIIIGLFILLGLALALRKLNF